MPDISNLYPRSSNSPVIFIIGVVLALIVTILLYCLVFPKKKDGQLPGFFQFLKNFFEVRYLLIEKIVKFLYVLMTFVLIFCGLFMMFTVEPFYMGLLTMILGPIILRIAHEFIMMLILLVKNTMEINSKLPDRNIKGKKVRGGSPADSFGGAPAPAFDQNDVQPSFVAPNQPFYNPGVKVCPHCGAIAEAGSDFCSECGSRMV